MDGMSVLLVGGFGIEGIASLDDIEPGTGGFVDVQHCAVSVDRIEGIVYDTWLHEGVKGTVFKNGAY